jgi:Transcriptional regulators
MITDARVTIGFLLNDVARQFRATFELKARGIGVTQQQWRALFYLSRCDGSTQTELADALEVERISAGRMVDKMVDSGFVERRADPSDRRVWRLHLLPPAYEIISKLNSISTELDAEALEEIPADKRQELLVLLERMREGLKRVRADSETRRNVA